MILGPAIQNNLIFPEEVMLHIVSFLSLRDLYQTPLVCKDWARILDDHFWRQKIREYFHEFAADKSIVTDVEEEWTFFELLHFFKKWGRTSLTSDVKTDHKSEFKRRFDVFKRWLESKELSAVPLASALLILREIVIDDEASPQLDVAKPILLLNLNLICEIGKSKKLESLLHNHEQDLSVAEKRKAFHLAIERGHLNIVQCWMDRANAKEENEDNAAFYPDNVDELRDILHMAAIYTRVEITKFILQKLHKMLLNNIISKEKGDSLVHSGLRDAMASDSLDIVKYYLRQNIFKITNNNYIENRFRSKEITQAIRFQRAEILKYLAKSKLTCYSPAGQQLYLQKAGLNRI